MIAPAPSARIDKQPSSRRAGPRFGGVIWRLVRTTNAWMLPLAGHRWNPIFAVVHHQGRKTARRYATPVAARHVAGGFVISLAFGTQVDWYRNLVAAGGGTLRWRDHLYDVAAPEPIDAATGRRAFHPIQRAFLWFGRIDGYVRLADASGEAH